MPEAAFLPPPDMPADAVTSHERALAAGATAPAPGDQGSGRPAPSAPETAVAPAAPVTTLHVCTTCRAGLALGEGEVPEGQKLFDAVAAALAAAPEAPVVLRASTCMANCERGCSAALTAPGKWQYLLAGLDPAMGADLVSYGRAYAATATGTVMPSKRPASLRHAVLGRVPPFTPAGDPAPATRASVIQAPVPQPSVPQASVPQASVSQVPISPAPGLQAPILEASTSPATATRTPIPQATPVPQTSENAS
ncbi:DUF1636 family protein [Roseomonas elaeocarpi]|uniref:DUF1636 family protein n=1 Tax=Roseomonas elaeocarpi TaxID=907779 RepID=A0ABV6JUF8_9PROT